MKVDENGVTIIESVGQLFEALNEIGKSQEEIAADPYYWNSAAGEYAQYAETAAGLPQENFPGLTNADMSDDKEAKIWHAVQMGILSQERANFLQLRDTVAKLEHMARHLCELTRAVGMIMSPGTDEYVSQYPENLTDETRTDD